jgi:hypothetical protein
MGLYVSSGALYPKSGGFAPLRGKLSAGVAFDAGQFLDWAAQSTRDMNGMVKDPGGPDMLSLSKHCDERILQWYGQSGSLASVQHARKRLGK